MQSVIRCPGIAGPPVITPFYLDKGTDSFVLQGVNAPACRGPPPETTSFYGWISDHVRHMKQEDQPAFVEFLRLHHISDDADSPSVLIW